MPGDEPHQNGHAQPDGYGGPVERRIVDALGEVYDPCCREKGISVVDMGLLEDVRVDDGRACVEIVLTTGWCPFVVHLLEAIRERTACVPGVDSADVQVSWNRPWTTDRLSDDARSKLRFLPDPAGVDRDAYVAARLPQSSGTATGGDDRDR